MRIEQCILMQYNNNVYLASEKYIAKDDGCHPINCFSTVMCFFFFVPGQRQTLEINL